MTTLSARRLPSMTHRMRLDRTQVLSTFHEVKASAPAGASGAGRLSGLGIGIAGERHASRRRTCMEEAHMNEPHGHDPRVGPQAADYLRQHGLVVVTAESCTAGLIAATLAEASGAGQVLESAFVVYDPKAKRRCLGVPAEVLAQHNLTSEPVARAMAQGALTRSDADMAIANTGVADGADPAIAAGTQCFAWLFRRGERVDAFSETRVFPGERNAVRDASARYALERIPHYHGQLTP